MRSLPLFFVISFSLLSLPVIANQRPTIEFNSQKYYLANNYLELNYTRSPVNKIELYFPEGETSDNYTKSIKRLSLLQVNDFQASANARISEYQEDNPSIPYQLFKDNQGKAVVNIAFWWPFRTNEVVKSVYVFQKTEIGVLCYVYTELEFFNPTKTTHSDLVKLGKSLLIDEKKVNLVKELNF